MKQLHKEMYEAPLAEILVVDLEDNLLGDSSVGIQSTRGNSYGNAFEDEWD